jgi:acetoacetyl-CoA synthetase
MLLQSKKELIICADLKPEDVFFYYTTTSVVSIVSISCCHFFLSGWMMWNFLISGLCIGCTLILYDGSPLKDPSYLWNLVDDLRITIFGTSAKYIDQLSVRWRSSISCDEGAHFSIS